MLNVACYGLDPRRPSHSGLWVLWAWPNYIWDMDMAPQSKEHLAATLIAKESAIAATVCDCHRQHPAEAPTIVVVRIGATAIATTFVKVLTTWIFVVFLVVALVPTIIIIMMIMITLRGILVIHIIIRILGIRNKGICRRRWARFMSRLLKNCWLFGFQSRLDSFKWQQGIMLLKVCYKTNIGIG